MKNKLNTVRIFCVALAVSVTSFGISMSYADEAENKIGDFSRGAKIWSENCNRCHNMRDPKEFPDDLWSPIVTHMRMRAGFTGQEARDVLMFLRQSNTPTPLYTAPKKEKKSSVKKKTSVPVGNLSKGANLANGKAIFQETCFACHGEDGTGSFPGVPDFTDKTGVLSQSDGVLFQHVLEGFQTPGSSMAMPAKGGNDDLSNNDVKDVVSYIQKTFNP